VEFDASHTPRDSIGDLARAAGGLLAGEPEQAVVWNTEPYEFEFKMISSQGRTRVEVHGWPDHRRGGLCHPTLLTTVELDTAACARALWRGLRRLEGAVSADPYATGWGHPFPTAAVARLEEQLRGRGQ
jgi:hypothetical protein